MSIIRRVARGLCRSVGKNEATFATHFNTPVRFLRNSWFVNERIVELPFIFQQIARERPGARLLEFGCSRSTLAISLASLGYRVTGVDLRPYPFEHPYLKMYQGNLLEFKDDLGFDLITSVSVLEHVGLGAYGETSDEEALQGTIRKLVSLLKEEGRLLVSVPIGRVYVDTFLRSFAPVAFKDLFTGEALELIDESYFCREGLRVWTPCTVGEVAEQDNSKTASGPTGVNGVGCFTWQKRSR